MQEERTCITFTTINIKNNLMAVTLLRSGDDLMEKRVLTMKKIFTLALVTLMAGSAWATEVTFDFTTSSGVSAMGLTAPRSDSKLFLTKDVAVSIGEVSLTPNTDKICIYNDDEGDMYLYLQSTATVGNQSFTISVPEGKKIKTIRFKYLTPSYINRHEFDSGTFEDEYVSSGNRYAEYCNWSGDAQAVKLTTTGNKIVAFDSFVVNYEEEPAQPQDYYLTGAFNNWGQNGNENIKFEANEDGDLAASVDLPAGENNGENGFKVIAYAEDGSTVWYGGEDANNLHYFEITDDLLGGELSLKPGDEFANLIVKEAGKYDLILKEAAASAASGAPAKAPAAGLKLIVTKAEEVTTAVTDLSVDDIAGVHYVNLAGQVSAAPFQGVNIMVTTMKDGSKRAIKVVK